MQSQLDMSFETTYVYDQVSNINTTESNVIQDPIKEKLFNFVRAGNDDSTK